MTSLEKMFKRLQVENENSVRTLTGKPLLTIPVELMSEDEYKAYMETKVKTKKEEVKVKPVEVKEVTETKKEKVEVETKKEEVKVKPVEVKTPVEKSVEPKKEEVKVIDNVDSLKSTVNFLKNELKRLSIDVDDKPVEEKPIEVVVEESKKEEAQESTGIDETVQKKVGIVKSKIAKIVKEASSEKITKPLIENYRKLTSSKKKIAIADMIKALANEVAKEKQCDMSDVLNFATNITTIANQNNKREYNSMINALKETLSKMKKSNLIDGIIEKLDKELKNTILLNKTKFVSSIKNMNTDLEITEENLDKVSAELDSISSRLNNGEDFDKINQSFGNNSEDNHIEAKVVDTDENNNEPNEEVSMSEDESTENIFLTMDEVDSLASTMNEVLMGI